MKPKRIFQENQAGLKISALIWGADEPELIFLHGGSQNAHTWDIVAMALGRPLIAVDLPGHGHSDWRQDHAYTPKNLASDIAGLIKEQAPNAKGMVGMSLGGLTSIILADEFPDLVQRLVLIDITPGVTRAKAEPILEFISGPVEFDSFEDILKYTQEYNPTRSRESLVRGIKYNAKELENGKWTWRWDPIKPERGGEDGGEMEFGSAWGALKKIQVPIALYKGETSGVVDEADIEEFLKCQPTAEVVVVPEAGHSIQGDKPEELAELINNFCFN